MSPLCGNARKTVVSGYAELTGMAFDISQPDENVSNGIVIFMHIAFNTQTIL
jgi:hypothetical protein